MTVSNSATAVVSRTTRYFQLDQNQQTSTATDKHNLPPTGILLLQLATAPKSNLNTHRKIKSTSELAAWGNEFLRTTNFALE